MCNGELNPLLTQPAGASELGVHAPRQIVAHAFIFHITFIIARHTANLLRIFHLPGFS